MNATIVATKTSLPAVPKFAYRERGEPAADVLATGHHWCGTAAATRHTHPPLDDVVVGNGRKYHNRTGVGVPRAIPLAN